MAPKRRKAKAPVDLAGDGDNDNETIEEAAPKRRRATGKRQKTTAETAGPEEPLPDGSGEGGAGTSAGPSTGVAETDKQKGKAKEDEPEKERRVDEDGRTVLYRPTASQDVRTRIKRAMPGSAHRMFLVDSRQLSPSGTPEGPSQEFHVLGATGNVYTVRISKCPRCSCPDFAKGHLCKHILFVMLRVLHQSPDNPVIWQRVLLSSEVEEVLGPLAAAGDGTAAVDQSVLATERVRQRYAALTGSAPNDGQVFGNGVQRPVEGECPICYDDMVVPAGGGGRGAEAIIFCQSCGNNMHKECFDCWARSKRVGDITCVYCRAPWKAEPGGGAAAAGDDGAGAAGGAYVNLSNYSEAHRDAPSLHDLYGNDAFFIMANSGAISRRQAARLRRGWS